MRVQTGASCRSYKAVLESVTRGTMTNMRLSVKPLSLGLLQLPCCMLTVAEVHSTKRKLLQARLALLGWGQSAGA